MSARLKLYVVAVVAIAAALLALGVPSTLAERWPHYLGWVMICVLSESLWLPTMSGNGTVSMGSTVGLSVAMLWGQDASMWIIALGTGLGELFVQRKPWVRALFNTSQMTITLWMASGVFALLGGPIGGLESLATLRTGEIAAARLAIPTLGLMAVYLLVNRALVAVAVSWSTDRRWLRVLREDWFYGERLIEDAAAFLLSPLMVIAFESVGYVGAVLFYAPLRMFNESHRRYLELQRAQNQLIHSERMAAKGEMAAEIGHELRNQLVAISGRAQMLLKEAQKETYGNVPRHSQIILDQAKQMEALSKGLMDFSRAELFVERVDVNDLLRRTIEFVRGQNRFDGVEWDVRLTDPGPELRADPGQLQQVLMNLFMNAADAMQEGAARRAIGVTCASDDRSRHVRVVVTDTGVGIPSANLARIFEPHFTTKPHGHGFGLSTSYRIITNHGGRIVAESPPGQGASFTLTLPLDGPGAWH